jgi:hypothetical protein
MPAADTATLQKGLSVGLATVKKAAYADLEAFFKKVEAQALRYISTLEHGVPATSKARPAVARKSGAKAQGAKAQGDILVDSAGNPVLNKDGTPRKRPGPPKGFRAGAVKGQPKASTPDKKASTTRKPGAPVKKGVTLSEKISSTKRAQKEGTKPTLREALISVFSEGGPVKSIKEATDALRKKGLLPNSEKPEQYIGSVLSQEAKNGGVFERADGERGKYRLSKKAAAPKPAAPAAPKAKTNGVAKNYDDVIQGSGLIEDAALG